MKKFTPYLFLLAAVQTFFCWQLIPAFSDVEDSYSVFEREGESGESKRDRIDLAIQQEVELSRDPATGRVPVEKLLAAKSYREKLNAQKGLIPLAPVTGINWKERGPNNVGGRSRVAWFDLGDAANGYKKVWAAAVGGGLWYTNDITAANPNWIKVNDFFDNIAITAFAQSANNPSIMYFGTGEGWFNADAIEGLGIWKSIDGGLTWNRLTSTANFAYVQDLQLDNSDNLYASVRSRITGHAQGIQKSVNGGITWTQVLGNPVQGPSTRGGDLELASNGDLYASIGFFATGRVYRSAAATNGINTGNSGTWDDITPDDVSNVVPISSSKDAYDRIELAVAPGNSNVVYAIFEGNGTQNAGFIKQYDPVANTWSNGTVPNIIDQGSNSVFTRGQAWYDLVAAVDPQNASRLYIGGIDALRSDNSGASWSQKTTWSLFAATGYTTAQNVHADIHAITYAPGSSTRMLIGSDGGIDYTEDANNANVGAYPTFVDKNQGYNVTQFYAVANHPTNPDFFLAGAQDNGTQKFTTPNMNATTEASGGDGGFCHIDQNEPDIMISSYTNNNYYVSTNGGVSFTRRFKSNSGLFINPTDYDDFSNILYGGNTAGTYFRYINPALDGATASVTVSGFNGASVTHVMVSPSISNRVYFGTNNGRVVRVEDANTGITKTGTVIFNPGVSGSVSCVAVDPANENHLLVTFSNYGVTSVWETSDGGTNWVVVEGNLPDMPVRWAIFDPRNSDWALLATELGVWSTDNLNGANTEWSPTNSGLANVRVNMLQYSPITQVLSAATHGRGLFTASVPSRSTTDINFQIPKAADTEATAGFTDCRRFKEFTTFLTISKAPVGDANVTLRVAAGSTAVQGADFDITTNGSFLEPSMVLTFPSGSSLSRQVTIRVYDDTEVEPQEFFNLAYTISGTTNAVPGASFQTYNFTINDNDVEPSPSGDIFVNIGAIDNSTANSHPFRSNFEDAKTQMLYTAAEFAAAGLAAGPISQIGFDIAVKNSVNAYQNFTIRMKQTDLTVLTGAMETTGFQTVVSRPNYFTSLGANDFVLQTPFVWDGTSNILVEVCFDNPAGETPSGGLSTVDVTKSTVTTTSMARWMRDNNSSCDALAGSVFNSFSGIGFMRPVFRVKGTVAGSKVVTTLNSSGTIFLGPFSDAYIYSSSGDLMAKVKNLSSHNYGCTEFKIDRSGSGAKAFYSANAKNFAADKTILITPSNNNPSGSYEVTLYYTQAEIAGWEAATGSTWSQAQVIKTKSAVSSYTQGSVPFMDIFLSTNQTRKDFGVNKSISAVFNNGFSGFAIGVPDAVLPVSWLDITGKALSDHNLIDWATGSEQGNAYFDIEISRNGSQFSKIGTVRSKGNSSGRQDYSFKHLRPESGINYYRLKQTDADGTSTYSKVVAVKSQSVADAKPFLFPTITSQQVTLNMGKLVSGPITLEIYDAGMNRVYRSATLSDFVQGSVNVSNLASGMYFLRVLGVDGQFNLKFVKQ